MSRFPVCLLMFVFSQTAAQSDSGQFIVHRHLKNIGRETYQLNRLSDGTLSYAIDCFYSDRGKDVPLKTMINLSPSGEPLKMFTKGFTSRMSQMNDSVFMERGQLIYKKDSFRMSSEKPAHLFPVDGYAPATVQGLLINWWIKNGKPAPIQGLLGPLEIKYFGTDSIQQSGETKTLLAFGIKNVIWGWEFLWMDSKSQLVSLITINAEGDKIEFVRPDYEDQLFFFARKSAEYGTRQYSPPARDNRPSVINHGVLVDIENGVELSDATIIMSDGKINWTGPSKEANIPTDAVITDAKGRYLLPGLWDMHAHLKQVEWGPAYIAAGITTVRDMANEFDFINTMKKTIDEDKGIGPNILRAGIIDGPGALGNGIMIASTPEQGIELVKKYKAAGFNQVKLYGSLEPAVIQAICDEAHREGLTVAGHIPRSITMMQGVDMGMNMISHIPYVMKAFEPDSNGLIDMNKPSNQKTLQTLLDKQIVVDPTLAIFEIIYHPLSQPVADFEPGIKKLPARLQDDFNNTGLSPAEAMKRKPAYDGWKKLVYQLYKAGVPIVAGTDMIIPGYSLYRELELYVSAGLTPLQALQCATSTPARVMGFSSSMGSLTKGKNADVILVDADPLQQISNIRKISMVFKSGQVYHPEEIYPMIEFATH